MGCSGLRLIAILIVGVKAPWYIHALAFGLCVGAICTYWDFLFGYDNHWFHGFMCGVASLPYVFFTHNWLGFIGVCITTTILMGLISALSGKAWIEENGRGAGLILPLPFLI